MNLVGRADVSTFVGLLGIFESDHVCLKSDEYAVEQHDESRVRIQRALNLRLENFVFNLGHQLYTYI